MRSTIASRRPAIESSSACAISDCSSARQPCTARSDAVASPASSARPTASQSEMPSPSASACSRVSEVSPTPRRGLFAIRDSDTPSYGLSIACR